MSRNKAITAHLVLHDIRSVHNVGAIFRTADAAGVAKIYLSGYTPGPLDRFGRKRRDFEKSALGADVPWERREDVLELLRELKEDFYLIAIEQDKRSVDYTKIVLREKSAILFGNEVDGLPKAVLDACESIAEIPMRGKKESLNVAVAAGIALFRMLGR
ncbi:TrmH family RNA methyltransferase [Candidatus Parcubacteria bacterium]|nr:TrmH family RNA methyltransferase [Candidatus Parcubacteria bacterium]